jgi:hypothetical protein
MIPFCVCCVTAAKIIPVACACQQISEGMQAPKNDPQSPKNPAGATTCDSSILHRIAIYTSRRLYARNVSIGRIASNGAPCSLQSAGKPASHQAMDSKSIDATRSTQRLPDARNRQPKRQPNGAKKSFASTDFPASRRRKSGFSRRLSRSGDRLENRFFGPRFSETLRPTVFRRLARGAGPGFGICPRVPFTGRTQTDRCASPDQQKKKGPEFRPVVSRRRSLQVSRLRFRPGRHRHRDRAVPAVRRGRTV